MCQCYRLAVYDIRCKACSRVFCNPPAVPHPLRPNRVSPEGQARFSPRLAASSLDKAFAQGFHLTR